MIVFKVKKKEKNSAEDIVVKNEDSLDEILLGNTLTIDSETGNYYIFILFTYFDLVILK